MATATGTWYVRLRWPQESGSAASDRVMFTGTMTITGGPAAGAAAGFWGRLLARLHGDCTEL